MPKTLYSRNWAFIDPPTQARLAHTTLLTAGTGLGSNIATLAARTGFGRFIVADGDVVDVSNLNRQAFFRRHVGRNKASATAELIGEIQPDAHVTVVPQFLTEATLPAVVADADIVVNTIDFDDPVFLACNRIARAQGKPVLLPLNLGWGAALYAFLPDAPTLESHLALAIARDGVAAIKPALVLGALGDVRGTYLAAPLSLLLSGEASLWPCDPQLAVAASVSAALTVTAAVSLARGESIAAYPNVAAFDAWRGTRPEGTR